MYSLPAHNDHAGPSCDGITVSWSDYPSPSEYNIVVKIDGQTTTIPVSGSGSQTIPWDDSKSHTYSVYSEYKESNIASGEWQACIVSTTTTSVEDTTTTSTTIPTSESTTTLVTTGESTTTIVDESIPSTVVDSSSTVVTVVTTEPPTTKPGLVVPPPVESTETTALQTLPVTGPVTHPEIVLPSASLAIIVGITLLATRKLRRG